MWLDVGNIESAGSGVAEAQENRGMRWMAGAGGGWPWRLLVLVVGAALLPEGVTFPAVHVLPAHALVACASRSVTGSLSMRIGKRIQGPQNCRGHCAKQLEWPSRPFCGISGAREKMCGRRRALDTLVLTMSLDGDHEGRPADGSRSRTRTNVSANQAMASLKTLDFLQSIEDGGDVDDTSLLSADEVLHVSLCVRLRQHWPQS